MYRDLLLVYDYTDAVSLLMKLPSNINVAYIVAAALHLKGEIVHHFFSSLSLYYSISRFRNT